MSRPIEDTIADIRRYAQMTLDSISIERRDMAEDILRILGDPGVKR